MGCGSAQRVEGMWCSVCAGCLFGEAERVGPRELGRRDVRRGGAVRTRVRALWKQVGHRFDSCASVVRYALGRPLGACYCGRRGIARTRGRIGHRAARMAMAPMPMAIATWQMGWRGLLRTVAGSWALVANSPGGPNCGPTVALRPKAAREGGSGTKRVAPDTHDDELGVVAGCGAGVLGCGGRS